MANGWEKIKSFLYEFWIFGLKQARACIFAGSFFILLFLSNKLPLGGLARYDFLFLAAVGIQIVLYLTKIETKDEVKTIVGFHLLGLGLELFKTHPAIAQWSYPEEGFFKIATVPLYSGFMYAAVGSYIAQAWRIFKLDLSSHKFFVPSIALCAAIYINFFSRHFIPDFRWLLIILVFILFWKSRVYFTVIKKPRHMPLALAFILIAFFIWIAENISTYLGAWRYPYQLTTWQAVTLHKVTSWFLLVIISFIIVADLKYFKQKRRREQSQ